MNKDLSHGQAENPSLETIRGRILSFHKRIDGKDKKDRESWQDAPWSPYVNCRCHACVRHRERFAEQTEGKYTCQVFDLVKSVTGLEAIW